MIIKQRTAYVQNPEFGMEVLQSGGMNLRFTEADGTGVERIFQFHFREDVERLIRLLEASVDAADFHVDDLPMDWDEAVAHVCVRHEVETVAAECHLCASERWMNHGDIGRTDPGRDSFGLGGGGRLGAIPQQYGCGKNTRARRQAAIR